MTVNNTEHQLRQAGGFLQFINAINTELFEKHKLKPEIVARDIRALVDSAYQIQLDYHKTNEIPIQRIHTLRDWLMKANYLRCCNECDFAFEETKFVKIGSCYPQDIRKEAIYSIKLLILMSIASLPALQRPTNRLIANLITTIDNLANKALKNAGNFALGMLCLDRQEVHMARERFSCISPDSDLYSLAQKVIEAVRELPQAKL